MVCLHIRTMHWGCFSDILCNNNHRKVKQSSGSGVRNIRVSVELDEKLI